MRWWIAVVTAGVMLLVIAGCGSSTKPSEAAEAAEIHEEKVEGELLLAEVETDQADLAQVQAHEVMEPDEVTKHIREDLRDARHTEHVCNEGDGLEQCVEFEAIEAVVNEMVEEVRAAR